MLQAIVTKNAVTPYKLVERLGQASADIRLVVDSFVSGELLDADHEQVGEDEWEERLFVTEKDLAFLEHWKFEDGEADEDGGL